MSEASPKCAQCEAVLPANSGSALCPKCLLQIGFETEPVPTGTAGRETYQPTFIPPTPEELAPRFPQLEILEVIGHGGMGVVYKARQIELDRIVALKILRPGISEDPGFAERFQREARALAKLNHPNIITVFDFGRLDSLFYFIMEYVDGTNLRHLNRVGELNPADALKIVPQVCSALQYAHDNGVVHRDIKPENILISKDGDLRIADFGLAKLAGAVDEAPLTGTWQVMGTPHYMAPEQFEKPTSVDHRADIYSLGVVIYELLTGELPLGRFPLPSDKVQVDVRLDDVVLRSLEKEPERRYQHVTEVASAVEAAAVPGESRFDKAREWVRSQAETVAGGAASLKDKSGGWTSAINRTIQWLGTHRQAIGAMLMVCGIIDVLLSAYTFTLAETSQPSTEKREFHALMSILAGSLAFFLGRQLRHGAVTRRMKLLALFSLVPWYNFLFITCIARVCLVTLGLLASLSRVDDPESAPESSDFAARMVGFFRTVLTPRIVFFSCMGVAGWAAVFAATSFVAYESWYRLSVPANYFLVDESAIDISPASLAYDRLHIDASTSGQTQGFDAHGALYLRKILRLKIQNRSQQTPTLEVDLNSGMCRMTGLIKERLSTRISKETVLDWMLASGVDVSLLAVTLEGRAIEQLLHVMKRTNGKCDRLTISHAHAFTFTQEGVRQILRDDYLMRNNIIPVGRLLDGNLFSVPRAASVPSFRIRAKSWAERLYFGTTFVVVTLGLLWVIRILYRQLWKPAFAASDSADPKNRVSWSSCSLRLAATGTLCCVALLALHNEVAKGFWRDSPWVSPPLADVSGLMAGRILMGYLAVAFVLAICGFLARPVFGRPGWWLGALGGSLAVLALPLNLLTFPVGLSTWIGLTDATVRDGFCSATQDTTEVTSGSEPDV